MTHEATEQINECNKCSKPTSLCICNLIKPIETKSHVLILQHPQEPDKILGTALLTHLALKNSTLKTGLSWPNLSKALGSPATNSNWGVLYLGSRSDTSQYILPHSHPGNAPYPPLHKTHKLDGLVLLDGTWSQAKTLWWRNPWLLKLKRFVLHPKERSLYGSLRKEPRRECLSTLEAAAMALDILEQDARAGNMLQGYLFEFLKNYKNHYKSISKLV